MTFYKLVGKKVVAVSSVEEVGEELTTMLKSTETEKYFVNTIFMGVDHGFSMASMSAAKLYNPIVFETMVFRKTELGDIGEDVFQERYNDYDAAIREHDKIATKYEDE